MSAQLRDTFVRVSTGPNRERIWPKSSWPLFSLLVVRILVAADSGEARVTQSILWRPFQKVDARYDERIQPAAHSISPP